MLSRAGNGSKPSTRMPWCRAALATPTPILPRPNTAMVLPAISSPLNFFLRASTSRLISSSFMPASFWQKSMLFSTLRSQMPSEV